MGRDVWDYTAENGTRYFVRNLYRGHRGETVIPVHRVRCGRTAMHVAIVRRNADETLDGWPDDWPDDAESALEAWAAIVEESRGKGRVST